MAAARAHQAECKHTCTQAPELLACTWESFTGAGGEMFGLLAWVCANTVAGDEAEVAAVLHEDVASRLAHQT